MKPFQPPFSFAKVVPVTVRGRIADWKDDRGFGFIEPESGGERVFFHITGVARGAPRPSVGTSVSYEETLSPDGKVRAIDVSPVGFAAVTSVLTSRRIARSVASILVFPALWCLVTLGRFPELLFWAYVGMSTVAFILYGVDKWAARCASRRTPEATLQWFALLGGWPGALLAQQVFRHKSSKRSFLGFYWFMVVLNCGGTAFLLSPAGASLVRQLLGSR